MPMIRELRVGTPGPFREADRGADERLLAGRARARRRWAIRTSLILLLTAATLCIFVTWRRDRMTVAWRLLSLKPAVATLQQRIDKFGMLPSVVPGLEKCYYASDSERFYAMNAAEPVIIAYQPRTHLMLRDNGRAVIIYEGGTVRQEWLPETGFRGTWRQQQERMKIFEEKMRSRPPELP